MTLDAMNWVWTNSQSKGNTRIALLYVADQVRTSACEVRIGQRELMSALNTVSKATAEAALKKAIDLRELEVVSEGTGRRPTLYRLPKAVGYVRTVTDSAPKTGAQDETSAPKTGAQRDDQEVHSAPKTGAQEIRSAPVFDASAPEIGAPPHTQTTQASQQAPEPDAFQICQPLVQAMTQAGITVSWSMQSKDWLEIAAVVRRAGVPAMVTFAANTKATTRQPIRYATFFLRGGWAGLPPAASPAAPLAPSASSTLPHCGDLDCHPDTRLREVEDTDGLPVLVPCPACHPATQGARP